MKKRKVAIVTGLIVASTLLSSTAVFAAPITSRTSQMSGFSGTIKTNLEALVAAGTITSSQETTVISALQASGQAPDRANRKSSALDALVTAGTITSKQETAIINAIKPSMPDTHDHAFDSRPSSSSSNSNS